MGFSRRRVSHRNVRALPARTGNFAEHDLQRADALLCRAKGDDWRIFFRFLSSVYIYMLIAAWCSAVTFYFLRDAPSHAFWPLLIWSYGVATSPWSYMAQRDQSVASFYSGFFTQVAFIVMMVCMAFGVDLLDGLQVWD